MRQGLARECGHGDVVGNIASIVEDAILAMRGERVECNVGDDAKIRVGGLECACGALGDAIG